MFYAVDVKNTALSVYVFRGISWYHVRFFELYLTFSSLKYVPSTGNRTRVCIIDELTLSVSNSFPNLALFRCVDVRGVLCEGTRFVFQHTSCVLLI